MQLKTAIATRRPAIAGADAIFLLLSKERSVSPGSIVTVSQYSAEDIMNDQDCRRALADANDAISENPELGEKSEKILKELMVLAVKRCDEKQYANAKDLLDLVRVMVASE